MKTSAVVLIDPEIMSGTPCFSSTRVPAQALLDYLEAGDSLDEFLPARLARELTGPAVKTVPQAGWAGCKNRPC